MFTLASMVSGKNTVKLKPKKKKEKTEKEKELEKAATMPSAAIAGEDRDTEEDQEKARGKCEKSGNVCGPPLGETKNGNYNRGKCCDKKALDNKNKHDQNRNTCHFKKRKLKKKTNKNENDVWVFPNNATFKQMRDQNNEYHDLEERLCNAHKDLFRDNNSQAPKECKRNEIFWVDPNTGGNYLNELEPQSKTNAKDILKNIIDKRKISIIFFLI